METMSPKNLLVRVSGALLIIGGGMDLFLLLQGPDRLSAVVDTLCAVLAILGILVGVAQIEVRSGAARWARWLWGIQIPIVAVPHLSFQIALGAKLQVLFYSTMTMQWEIAFGSDVVAHMAPIRDRYFVGINALALVVVILLSRRSSVQAA